MFVLFCFVFFHFFLELEFDHDMDHDQGGPGCNPCGHHDTTSIHPIHAVIKFELSHLNGQDSSKFLKLFFGLKSGCHKIVIANIKNMKLERKKN